MKTQAGKCLLIALAAVFFCVGGYWFFFAGGSSGWGTGGSGQGAQQAASQSAEQEAKESKAKEDKAAEGSEAAAADAKEAQEAKPEDEAKKKDGKSVYPLQVMIMEAKRAEEIEGAAKGAQGAHILFAQHPANGIRDIALAAAIRSDNGGDARMEFDFNLIGKRFEATGFEAFQLQIFSPT